MPKLDRFTYLKSLHDQGKSIEEMAEIANIKVKSVRDWMYRHKLMDKVGRRTTECKCLTCTSERKFITIALGRKTLICGEEACYMNCGSCTTPPHTGCYARRKGVS